MDYEVRELKRKATAKARGSRLGRPPATDPILKVCKNEDCQKEFLCTTAYQKERDYCAPACYHLSRRGKRTHTTEFLKSIDKSYMQSEEYRSKMRKEHTPAFKRYRNRVTVLSEKTYVQFQSDINPNSFPRTISGVEGGYQLDHVKSVLACFKDGDTPEFASRKENLHMLPWLDNLKKGA